MPHHHHRHRHPRHSAALGRVARVATVAAFAYLICCTTPPSVAAETPTPTSFRLDLCPPHPAEPTAQQPCHCEPSADPSDAGGGPGIRQMCASAGLNDTWFRHVSQLQPFVAELDMSYNMLAEAPTLQGSHLRQLNLSHNFIGRLYDSVFAGLGERLRDLGLAWNRIEYISVGAFAGLSALESLDLSRNHLARLANSIFSSMPALVALDMSRNRLLNSTLDAPEYSLFLTLGLSTRVRRLRLEDCGLRRRMQLVDGVGLEEVYLKYNRLVEVPDVARGVRVLDLSGNPVRELVARSFPHLGLLEELYLQDMPNLTSVGEYALQGMPSLRRVSFVGSWKLRRLDAMVFGAEEVETDPANRTTRVGNLTELDLSGTALQMLDTSVAGSRLRQVLVELEVLNLAGAPIRCSCELGDLLGWKASRRLIGECAEPAELRGRKLREVREDELDCRRWPGWVYQTLNGLLILGLLVVCVTATWCLVTHIRPRSRREQLQKVGDTSPYARVTIERAEV